MKRVLLLIAMLVSAALSGCATTGDYDDYGYYGYDNAGYYAGHESYPRYYDSRYYGDRYAPYSYGPYRPRYYYWGG